VFWGASLYKTAFFLKYDKKEIIFSKRGCLTYSVIQPYEFVLTAEHRHFAPFERKMGKLRRKFLRKALTLNEPAPSGY